MEECPESEVHPSAAASFPERPHRMMLLSLSHLAPSSSSLPPPAAREQMVPMAFKREKLDELRIQIQVELWSMGGK